MPDTTQKLEAARKLVGTYWRGKSGCFYRVVDVNDRGRFTILSIRKDTVGIDIITHADMSRPGKGSLIPLSRKKYLSVAGPLFAELAEMAGIAMKCCDNQAKQEGP